MKIPNKRELEQIASNHLSDIEFDICLRFHEPFLFLVDNTTFPSDNPFRKNLL